VPAIAWAGLGDQAKENRQATLYGVKAHIYSHELFPISLHGLLTVIFMPRPRSGHFYVGYHRAHRRLRSSLTACRPKRSYQHIGENVSYGEDSSLSAQHPASILHFPYLTSSETSQRHSVQWGVGKL